ncbi:MAG: ATP synthase F1 subunit delta [Chitinispirillaceae bacterium]|nr:ATP synthase F1 subunit delta [Chitinispirillaceae bacterium]
MKGIAELTEIYAEALLATATASGLAERVEEDTALVGACLRVAPELHRRLCMPSIPRNERLYILRKLFEGHLCELTFRCMELLLKRGRISLLPELHDAILRVREKSAGVVDVEVTSAHPIDEEQRRLFEKKIRGEFDPASRVRYATDSALVGGYTIRSPERLIDHSLQNGLRQLRKRLLEQ